MSAAGPEQDAIDEQRAFPSLRIGADRIEAHGSFASAQARFLDPDRASVEELDAVLARGRIGVVAHFYMDSELQGVLGACSWPHIHTSDSLAMADKAIEMVEAGARRIVVLGVDFMSENVRALLDATGHHDVPVYRAATEAIGCSLAEAADAEAYTAWLEEAAATPNSLHVIYINTSLGVKARAQTLVPTITCTSSNVVRTILAAAAQVPEGHIWFGPDSYMGANLATMLERYAAMDEEAVRRLHPQHTPATVAALRERFHWFRQGTCIVHHMFGREVAERVRREWPHASVAAHLEVPGEMFSLALERASAGRGVVGSTSDILGFIHARVDEVIAEVERSGDEAHPTFVLGTEAGMITPIVRSLQSSLRRHRARSGVEVDASIVFPVAAEAVATTDDAGLALVPGVASGEGCSTAGGCATCPFMKMNSLDALLDVCARIARGDDVEAWQARRARENIGGQPVAELAGRSILAMRAFQRDGRLSDELIDAVRRR